MEDKTQKELRADELAQANQLFASVWGRVVQNTQAGPIALCTQEEPKDCCQLLTAPMLAQAEEAAPVEEYSEDEGEEQFFLGRASAEALPLLQGFFQSECARRRRYRALARQGGLAGRQLASLAARSQQAAKRLGAACFFLSGTQIREREGSGSTQRPYLEMLRLCFIEEQAASVRYLAAAAETRDPWLLALFTALGEERLQNATQLLLLAEQV